MDEMAEETFKTTTPVESFYLKLLSKTYVTCYLLCLYPKYALRILGILIGSYAWLGRIRSIVGIYEVF